MNFRVNSIFIWSGGPSVHQSLMWTKLLAIGLAIGFQEFPEFEWTSLTLVLGGHWTPSRWLDQSRLWSPQIRRNVQHLFSSLSKVRLWDTPSTISLLVLLVQTLTFQWLHYLLFHRNQGSRGDTGAQVRHVQHRLRTQMTLWRRRSPQISIIAKGAKGPKVTQDFRVSEKMVDLVTCSPPQRATSVNEAKDQKRWPLTILIILISLSKSFLTDWTIWMMLLAVCGFEPSDNGAAIIGLNQLSHQRSNRWVWWRDEPGQMFAAAGPRMLVWATDSP